MISEDFSGKVSLLWPKGGSEEAPQPKDLLSENSYTDIGLDEIINEFGFGSTGACKNYIKSIFTSMCEDVDVINYRLDIIDDMVNCSEVEECIGSIFAIASEVERYSKSESVTTPDVQKLVKSFRETDLYGSCLNRARKAMLKIADKLKSEGLCKLRDKILKLSEEFAYVDTNNETEEKKEYIKSASITLGINLDMDLRPMEATLVSINDYKYTRAPFLNRLIKKPSEFESIHNFHPSEEGGLKEKIIEEFEEASGSVVKVDSTALQLSLISDLDRIMKNTMSSLRFIIRRYTNTYSKFFIDLKYELLFYVGSVKIINKLRTMGMPMTRPKAQAKEIRAYNIEGFYNINLALKQEENRPMVIVQNDLSFAEEGNIFILTGPNSGGKTTYINAISLIQVLFQAGMYVPSQKACISPVDNIYTHFSSEEKRDTDYGRLGEEAKRLCEIFKRATKYSLIILNESLASTSPGECLYMSKDIVCGLKLLNAKAIFATHQHELALAIDELNNKSIGIGEIKSLVAGAQKRQGNLGEECFIRTYKVLEGPPQGISYAKDIAESFGISYEQIKKTINERLMI